MAAATLIICGLLWGGLVYVLSGRSTRHLWVILLGLPLSAAINVLVKGPLAVAVASIFGLTPNFTALQPVWFLLFLFLLAPVFEEAVKPLPLLMGRVRGLVKDPASALVVGMSLGMGFGIGEAAYLAYGIAQTPQYIGLPWYLFTGYLFERTLVCFIHGVMTAVVVTGFFKEKLPLAYFFAVCLHSFVNMGAVLMRVGLTSPSGTFLLLIASTILFCFIFEWLRRGSRQPIPAS